MAKSARIVVAVLITCVASATGLSLTYAVTAPRIAEQDRLAEERSLQAVAPPGAEFEEVSDEGVLAAAMSAADPVEVTGVFRVNVNGAPVGWAIKVASRGYGGQMRMVIGLDGSGLVTGVSILSHNETPGLGTRVLTEEWFMEQFDTLPGGFTDADVRGLDVISGTTRSSNGVRNGVAAAGRVFADVLAGEGGDL